MQQQVPSGNSVILAGNRTGALYITFDNIEIANQNVQLVNSANAYESGCGLLFTHWNTGNPSTGPFSPAAGIIVQNLYIHDWVSTSNFANFNYTTSSPGGTPAECLGGVSGAAVMSNSTVSDAAGFGFIGSTQTNQWFGGGCYYCGEVKNSTFHDAWYACHQQPLFNGNSISCHDSEFYHIGYNGLCSTIGQHDHVIYDNQTGSNYSGFQVYNNYLHDNATGLLIYGMYNMSVYNNVAWNNTNAPYITVEIPCEPAGTGNSCDSSSFVGWIYNNTMDCSTGVPCVRTEYRSGSTSIQGQLFIKNNLWITNSNVYSLQLSGATIQNNYTMPTSEASKYGFTSGSKYFPTSSDPNVAGKGVNLLSSPSSLLGALAYDTEGASWFGGSPVARTAWDLGAFVMGAQSASAGPPTKPNPPSGLAVVVN